MILSPVLLEHAKSLLRSHWGLEFPGFRETDLEWKLEEAARLAGMPDSSAFLGRLAAEPESGPLWTLLAQQVTVGETYFFREQAAFEFLERQFLPALIAGRRAQGLRSLRIWSAGCASGEEPYSVAMLLDRLLPDPDAWSISILGTDLNPSSLEAARRGVYRDWSFRETPAAVRDRYFEATDGCFELLPRIRERVRFSRLNLARDEFPDTSGLDLILCRNVLMYLTAEVQDAAAARFERALAPGGVLLISAVDAPAAIPGLERCGLAGGVIFEKRPAAQKAQAPEPASDAPPAPPPAPEPLDAARRLADRGQLEQAERLCRQALHRNRLDAKAHLLMAAILQERGDLRAARQALERSLFVDGKNVAAHFALASLAVRCGEPSRARAAFGTVIELLTDLPAEELVPGSGGLTAARLLESARHCLDTIRD